MSWLDRLREAAYTSPSGVRVTFHYEDVSRSFNKKTSAFEFPDADGTYVQDNGVTGRRYPLRVFFWGADYDQEAAAFEGALSERGPGLLDHPIYGQVAVVPFGEISRRDDLVSASNQAVVELTFWDTTGVVYPSSQSDPVADVLAALEVYNQASAADFASMTDLDGAVEQSKLRGTVKGLLDNVKSKMAAAAAAQAGVQRQFNAITDSIDTSIDILVGDPLALAFQTSIMIQAPARALSDIRARLDAYRNLAGSIFGQDSGDRNQTLTLALNAQGAVSGSALSSVNNQYQTRTEALQTADDVLGQFDDLIAWRDGKYADLGIIDIGSGYQALQSASALLAGYLVQLSFSLRQERRIVLDRNRTIIDLAAELYGSVDDRLDFLIQTNSLTGSEILELPAGRAILYYE